ncbi:hypothetical protein CS022_07575 [Veronia nyctiphanis]|uniref:Uncharacterized protein n=2 Tax=Veronia nyctiphanis TaxID=1278244 RepID=A0A4Q0YRM4_9GAMM|nr:hypothetical protein CS022_07575 [Veronia nyctiphanis]
MRDIVLTSETGSLDYWPKPLPDLYLQEPLMVAFEIPKGATDLMVTGELNQRRWQHKVSLTNLEASAEKASGIDVLWARNQIKSIGLNPDLSADEKREKITQLGLSHHIVTAHTSLIAVDKTPVRPLHLVASDKSIALNRPSGMAVSLPTSNSSPRLAQAGLGSDLLTILACLMLVAGLGLMRLRLKLFGECEMTIIALRARREV